jgi:hypothetical protein
MGLPVTIFIAYPDVPQIPLKDFNADIKKAKQYGVGLISISENHEGAIQYHGMPVNLFLSAPDFNRFKQPIRPGVMSAYEDFTDGNPDGGVQKLGQLVESAIVNLAIQARNKGTYKKGGFVEGKYYPQGNLIDELMHERIIDNGVLGRCRGFCDDRGSVSHKPRDLKEAIRIQKSLKECFLLGLRILEELPAFLIKKGYRFRT